MIRASEQLPDTVLPSQLQPRHSVNEPERRLLAAVVEDAFAILKFGPHQRYREDGQRSKYREVVSWFESECRDVMSFRWCCEQLGLSTSAVRLQVAAIMAHGVPARRKPRARENW